MNPHASPLQKPLLKRQLTEDKEEYLESLGEEEEAEEQLKKFHGVHPSQASSPPVPDLEQLVIQRPSLLL